MAVKNVIYSLVGGFISKSYKLATWEYNGEKIIAPTPSLALFKYLKEYKKQNVKLKILIPLSIYFRESSKDIITEINDSSKDFSILIENFKEDFESFYSKKLNNLLNKFKDNMKVKNSKQIFDEIKIFISFFKKDLDWGTLEEIFNELVTKDIDLKDFYEQLKDFLEKSKIFQILYEEDLKWKELLQDNISYEIIPSIGSYEKDDKILKFNGQFQDRTLYFYTLFAFDFIKEIKQIGDNDFNFYLDISVGLNSLMVEILESFYNSIVFWNFYFLGKKENKAKFFLVSAEPVMGIPKTNDIKHFSTEEIKRIAFFSKPLTKAKIESESFKEFIKKLNFKGLVGIDFEEITNQSILLFNILEKAIILGLLLQEKLLKPDKIIEELYRFLKIKKEIFSKDFIKINNAIIEVNINSKRLDTFYFRNLTYLIMLGANLTQNLWDSFKEFYKEDTENLEFIEEALPIEKVRRNFKELFEKYNLDINGFFLDKEWNDRRINSLKNRASKEEKYLAPGTDREYKCKNIYDYGLEKYLSRNLRNFLAHMGAEDCITKFYKNNNILYLKYDEKFKKIIKKLILNDFNL